MHLNNGGINRPSLLSGGAQTKNAASATGRILADMEGRPVAGAARAAAPADARSRRRVWLALLALAVVVLAALAAWRFTAGSVNDEPMGYSLPPEAGVSQTTPPDAAPAPGGATIVDAPAGAEADTPAADPLAGIGDAADAAEPAAPAAHTAATTGAAVTAASTGRKPAAAATASRAARDKAKGDENLLGTLMGIIKEDEKSTSKAKATPDSMDALIAQIQADERRHAADTDNAFDTISGRNATASTKSNIQAKLRSCGSATSAAGLNCRKKVCAAVAGKDPACPAM